MRCAELEALLCIGGSLIASQDLGNSISAELLVLLLIRDGKGIDISGIMLGVYIYRNLAFILTFYYSFVGVDIPLTD